MPTQKTDPNNPPGFGPPITNDSPAGFGPPVSTFTQAPDLPTPPPPPTFTSRLGETTGVPTSTDQAQQMGQGMNLINSPAHPVLAALGNAVIGPAGGAVKALYDYGKNLVNQAKESAKETREAPDLLHRVAPGVDLVTKGLLGPVGGQAVDNLADDYSQRNYGAMGGDAVGTLVNLLLLGHGKPVSEETQLNKLTAAAGAKGARAIENTQQLLNQTRAAESLPVNSVDDFRTLVNKTKDNINAEYGNALGPYANSEIAAHPISDAIMGLITPDMKYTAEGRAEIQAIKSAALEYQKPWTLGALDSKRTRLSSDLSSHNAKESVSRYTAEKGNINLAIDNKILDTLRDVVYPQADTLAGKPPGYFEDLKQQQSNLIQLEKVLNNRIDDLTGKTREQQGASPLSRVHGGVGVAANLHPHGYLGGLTRMLHAPDLIGEADKAAAKGMNGGNPVSRGLVLSYPARWLALNQNSQQ